MGSIATKVATELREATGLSPKSGDAVEEYYNNLLDVVTDEKKFPDKKFKALSKEARKWVDVATEAFNSDEPIPAMTILDGHERQSKIKGGTKMAKKAKKAKAAPKVTKKAKGKKAGPKSNGVDSVAVVAAARKLRKAGVDQSEAYTKLRKQFGVKSLSPVFKREDFSW